MVPAPVPTLVDLCLLSEAWSDADLPDHLRLVRLPFVRTRRKVQALLRFPTKQAFPHVAYPRQWNPHTFVLELPKRIRMQWIVHHAPATFSWLIFECHHLGPRPDSRELAEYTYRVKWNETFEGNNVWTYSCRP